MKKVTPVLQSDASDCGLACLAMLFRSFSMDTSLFELKLKHPASSNGTSIKALLDIVNEYDCVGKAFKIDSADISRLSQLTYAVILFVENNHFVVLEGVSNKYALIADPKNGKKKISLQELFEIWDGVVVQIQPSGANRNHHSKFNLQTVLAVFKAIKGKWALYIATTIIAIFVNLTFPWLLGRVTSSFINELDSPITIEGYWPHILAIGFVVVASYWLKERVTLSLRLTLDKSLTFEFVEKLFKLPLRFFNKYSTGDILNRVGSTSVMREFYTSSIASLLIEVLVVFALCVALFIESPMLALVVLVAIIALVSNIMFRWNSYKNKLREEVYSNATNSDNLTDFLSGVSTIKSLGKEDIFAERWKKSYSDFLSSTKNSNLERIKIGSVHTLVDRGLPALILIGALTLFMSDKLSQQSAFYCYFLLTWLSPSLINLVSISIAFLHLSIHSERLSEFDTFVKTSKETSSIPLYSDADYTINLKSVNFKYDSDSPLLFRDLNLNIDRNGFHVITGSSGVGKSTLLKIIANHIPLSEGELSIAINKDGETQVYKEFQGINYLGQSPYIFRGTILDNLTMFSPEKFSNDDIFEACKMAGIHTEIIEMRHGYNTALQFNGENISGGQRQRIALARILLMNPPILVLDECTNQLHKKLEENIIGALRRRNGITIIASHKTFWLRPEDSLYEVTNQNVTKINCPSFTKFANA